MKLIGLTTIILWLLVCLSALSVAYSNHSARLLFITWQEQLKEHQRLEVEWGQLLIEKSTLTAYARLESVASKKLGMVVPKVQQIQLVRGE
jgi:cell division protein FtsL